jgi:hypothetical protein
VFPNSIRDSGACHIVSAISSSVVSRLPFICPALRPSRSFFVSATYIPSLEMLPWSCMVTTGPLKPVFSPRPFHAHCILSELSAAPGFGSSSLSVAGCCTAICRLMPAGPRFEGSLQLALGPQALTVHRLDLKVTRAAVRTHLFMPMIMACWPYMRTVDC